MWKDIIIVIGWPKEASGLWIMDLRRMEWYSWKDKVTNADLLQRVHENRSILDAIWCPKHTVKPLNLPAVKVGNLACKIIFAPFILANSHLRIQTLCTSSIFVTTALQAGLTAIALHPYSYENQIILV